MRFRKARLRTKLWPISFAGAALALAESSCTQSLQPTTYLGDGEYGGSPPICLQYREESRPASRWRTLLVHFNNTCDYPLDCSVYNDATEQEQRVGLIANRRFTLVVEGVSEVTRFDVELDCIWRGS